MRIKFYYQFEMIIFIVFPYMIFSNDDIKENCDNNITKFLLEDCTMNLTNPDDKFIFKNDIIKMLSNGSLPDIKNILKNSDYGILKEDTYESYYLFNLRGQYLFNNHTYINFANSICYSYFPNNPFFVLKIHNNTIVCSIDDLEVYSKPKYGFEMF